MQTDSTGNVIGEWAGSSPDVVAMVTAHLDHRISGGETDVSVKREGRGRLSGARDFRQWHGTRRTARNRTRLSRR